MVDLNSMTIFVCVVEMNSFSQAARKLGIPKATVVHLYAYAKNTEIWLELEDDGIGFNPNETTAGFGLQGMQERIQLLNGQFSIHSVEALQIHIELLHGVLLSYSLVPNVSFSTHNR